jgi:hypothetical protein
MSEQRAAIGQRIGDIETQLGELKEAFQRNDPQGVLAKVQRMNLYIQDLLLKAHKYRVQEKLTEEEEGA